MTNFNIGDQSYQQNSSEIIFKASGAHVVYKIQHSISMQRRNRALRLDIAGHMICFNPSENIFSQHNSYMNFVYNVDSWLDPF